MDEWILSLRKVALRFGRFLALSAGSGFMTLVKPLGSGLNLAVNLVGITAAAVIAALLGAGPGLTVAVVIIALLIVLLVGAFRRWDELQAERESRPKGSRASATGFVHREPGDPRPDEIGFDLVMAESERTVNLTNPLGKGAPRAVRFVEQDRTIRPEDIPQWIKWGWPWQRRRLLVKGFTPRHLLLEKATEIPDGIKIEVFHDEFT